MDSTNKELRSLGRAPLGVSLTPWLNLAIWTIAALVVKPYLQRFPQWTWEDAPWTVFLFCCPMALVSSLLLVLSIPVWYVLFFKRTSRWKDSIAWRADVVYCMGWATNFLLAWADPNYFLRWFIHQIPFVNGAVGN